MSCGLGGSISNVVILLLAYFLQKVNLRMMDDLYFKPSKHILKHKTTSCIHLLSSISAHHL